MDPKVPANDMHRLEALGGLLVNWRRSHRRCAATGTKLLVADPTSRYAAVLLEDHPAPRSICHPSKRLPGS